MRDRDRGNYFVAKANKEGLPDFTFLALPDDHTEGSTPGPRQKYVQVKLDE